MIKALRRWARRYTDEGRYTPVGILFHWIMAALVLFQLGWGFYMGFMKVGGDKLAAYQFHGEVGLLILILAVGRVTWRLLIPGPINNADKQGVKTQIAAMIHFLFYLAFFALPLSGWIMWSSAGEPGPLILGGLLPWPQLPLYQMSFGTRGAILDVAEDVHFWLVWLLLLIVPLHVGAALKHHFWDRNDVLRGMLPEIPDAEAPPGGSRHSPQEPTTR